MSILELQKAIEAKRKEKEGPAAEAARLHEEAFWMAYLKALDTYDEAELVSVEVPRVGKVLLRFASRPDHAQFTKAINEKVEVSPCLTFSSKCAVWPPPVEFKELLETKNPEGFITCAMAVKTAMTGKVLEEGKG